MVVPLESDGGSNVVDVCGRAVHVGRVVAPGDSEAGPARIVREAAAAPVTGAANCHSRPVSPPNGQTFKQPAARCEGGAASAFCATSDEGSRAATHPQAAHAWAGSPQSERRTRNRSGHVRGHGVRTRVSAAQRAWEPSHREKRFIENHRTAISRRVAPPQWTAAAELSYRGGLDDLTRTHDAGTLSANVR